MVAMNKQIRAAGIKRVPVVGSTVLFGSLLRIGRLKEESFGYGHRICRSHYLPE